MPVVEGLADLLTRLGQFLANMGLLVREQRDLLLAGLLLTVQLALLAGLVSVVLGLLVALLRVSPLAPLRALGTAYVEFIRNVPLLAHLFFWVYGLPFLGILLDLFPAAVAGLGVYTSAYVAESVRAGIIAVGRGQLEASRALGLRYAQMMRHVVLPQALAIVVPPLGNLAIAMTKNTSVAAAITLPELLYQTQVVNARTFLAYETFLLSAGLYLLLTLPMGAGVARLERRMTRFRTTSRA